MKKLILGFVLAATLSGAANAVTIYDIFGAASGDYAAATNPGANYAGDNLILPNPGAGKHWRITGMDFAVALLGAGTYTGLNVDFEFFNKASDGTTGDPAFGSSAGGFNGFIGSITNSVPSGYLFGIDGLSIDLAPTPVDSNGYGLTMRVNQTGGPDQATNLFRDAASTIAGSSSINGFWADINPNDGVLIDDDEYVNFSGWTSGNLAVTLRATAVPEPATLAGIGMGLAALAALRRRKAR
jgi:hypothetical protein